MDGEGSYFGMDDYGIGLYSVDNSSPWIPIDPGGDGWNPRPPGGGSWDPIVPGTGPWIPEGPDVMPNPGW